MKTQRGKKHPEGRTIYLTWKVYAKLREFKIEMEIKKFSDAVDFLLT